MYPECKPPQIIFRKKWSVRDKYLCSQRCADFASVEEILEETLSEDDELDDLCHAGEEEDWGDVSCDKDEWDKLFWETVDMDVLTEYWREEDIARDTEMTAAGSNEADDDSSDDGLPSFDLGVF